MLRLYLLINFMMPWLEEFLCGTVLVVCPSLALFVLDKDLSNEFKHIQYDGHSFGHQSGLYESSGQNPAAIECICVPRLFDVLENT